MRAGGLLHDSPFDDTQASEAAASVLPVVFSCVTERRARLQKELGLEAIERTCARLLTISLYSVLLLHVPVLSSVYRSWCRLSADLDCGCKRTAVHTNLAVRQSQSRELQCVEHHKEGITFSLSVCFDHCARRLYHVRCRQARLLGRIYTPRESKAPCQWPQAKPSVNFGSVGAQNGISGLCKYQKAKVHVRPV